MPLAALAHEGPAVCALAVRALESDAELARMLAGRERSRPPLASRLGEICGAEDPASLAHAIEALRGVLWEALRDRLEEPSARVVADAGDRLSFVCSAMLASALERARPAQPRVSEEPSERVSTIAARSLAYDDARPQAAAATVAAARSHAYQPGAEADAGAGGASVAAGAGAGGVAAGAGVVASAGERLREPRDARAPAGQPLAPPPASASAAVIVDELDARPARARESRAEDARAGEQPSLSEGTVEQPPPRPAAAPSAGSSGARERASGCEAPPSPAGEIAIRDQRREEGPSAWIGSIGSELARFERDGVPFAVLLFEPVELERLRSELSAEDLLRASERLEESLAGVLDAWSGSLTRERPGRCWLLVPGVERSEAERLAARLVAVAEAAAAQRGAPLALAIGTAVCPHDGRQAAALAAHADIGLYAARSAARAQRPPVRVEEQ